MTAGPVTIGRSSNTTIVSTSAGTLFPNDAVLSVTPRCRLCQSPIRAAFLDHGLQPIANGFLDEADFPQERRYPIRYGFCAECCLVQLLEPPPFGALFHDRYPYLTGTSATMQQHYATMAIELRRRWQPKSVLEVGANDGTLLQHFADLDHLGIEPSANVAALATAKGLRVQAVPFGAETACRLAMEGTRSIDLIVAAHVVTHLPDLNDFLRGVDILLAPDGVLVLEDPSLDAIMTSGDFAQLYDEHAWVLSVPAMQTALGRHGFQLVDAEPNPTHGGSMRLTAERVGRRGPHHVTAQLQRERYLTHRATYSLFGEEADRRLAHLRELLCSYHAGGKRIAALGASSKLTLALNRLHLPAGVVEYVTDTTPTKIGKFMPGTHEAIIAREDAGPAFEGLDADGLHQISYVLCGAYVHREYICAQERPFLERGGKFIFWTPRVQAIGKDDL